MPRSPTHDVHLRFRPQLYEALKLDAEREDLPVATFLMRFYERWKAHADQMRREQRIDRRLQQLEDGQARAREVSRINLAVSYEAAFHACGAAHPPPQSEQAKSVADAAIAAKRKAARETAERMLKVIYQEQA